MPVSPKEKKCDNNNFRNTPGFVGSIFSSPPNHTGIFPVLPGGGWSVLVFWTLVMTLGFLRRKLPVSEVNKLSLEVSGDCPPGWDSHVPCFCFPPYLTAFEANWIHFLLVLAASPAPFSAHSPEGGLMWSFDSPLLAPRENWTHCFMGFPLG